MENFGFNPITCELDLLGGDNPSGSTLVKYVRSGDTFPATRADGSPLVLGDYVKPTGTLPFTIGTVTFADYKDQAVWTGVEWLYNANAFQKTNETPVADKTAESVSGTANYQSQINTENKAEILARAKQVATMPAPTAAMIGKPCVQYVGNSTTAFTHNRFYEVVADGASVKWQECQVSEGVKPYINGVLLDGDLNTEDIKVIWRGTQAEYDAIAVKCDHTLYIITDTDADTNVDGGTL